MPGGAIQAGGPPFFPLCQSFYHARQLKLPAQSILIPLISLFFIRQQNAVPGFFVKNPQKFLNDK
jgi:hypothetical protein